MLTIHFFLYVSLESVAQNWIRANILLNPSNGSKIMSWVPSGINDFEESMSN